MYQSSCFLRICILVLLFQTEKSLIMWDHDVSLPLSKKDSCSDFTPSHSKGYSEASESETRWLINLHFPFPQPLSYTEDISSAHQFQYEESYQILTCPIQLVELQETCEEILQPVDCFKARAVLDSTRQVWYSFKTLLLGVGSEFSFGLNQVLGFQE